MPHRLGQFARRARRVLEDGEIIGGGRWHVGRGQTFEARSEVAIGGEHPHVREGRLPGGGVALDHEHPRLAIVEAQRHTVRPEQREQRDGNGPALHGAEQRTVERQRRLQHDRDPVAALDPLALEEVREARRPGGQGFEIVLLAPAIGELHAQRRAAAGVAVDTLVGDVETTAIAVEQLPERVPAEARQRLAITPRGHHPLQVSPTSAVPAAVVSPRWFSATSDSVTTPCSSFPVTWARHHVVSPIRL